MDSFAKPTSAVGGIKKPSDKTTTDKAIALWDGSEATALKNSQVTVDAQGNVETPGNIDAQGGLSADGIPVSMQGHQHLESDIPGLDKYSQAEVDAFITAVHSVPVGGTIGQVLTKTSDTDYDTEWGLVEGGGSGILVGTVDPDDSIGGPDDLYLNTVTRDLFSKTAPVYAAIGMSSGTPMGGNNPANTIDASLTTYSDFSPAASNWTWTIDFGEGGEIEVPAFVLSVYAYANWSCRLQGRNLPEDPWMDLSEAVALPLQNTGEKLYVPNTSGAYRYYKIYFWTASGGSVLKVHDVKFLQISGYAWAKASDAPASFLQQSGAPGQSDGLFNDLCIDTSTGEFYKKDTPVYSEISLAGATAYADGAVKSALIDGDLNTKFDYGYTGSDSEAVVDLGLGKARTVSKMQFTALFENNPNNTVRVYGRNWSSEGWTWLYTDASVTDTIKTTYDFEFPQNDKAFRYYRIYFSRNGSSTLAFELYEIKLFETTDGLWRLLGQLALDGHAHTETDITDLNKYKQDEVDTLLSEKASTSHGSDHTNGTDDIPTATDSSKGLLPALSGNASEFLTGQGGWASPVSPAGLKRTVVKPTTIALLDEDVAGTLVVNYGQNADLKWKLPSADEGFEFTCAVSTPGHPIRLVPDSKDTVYLNGAGLNPLDVILSNSPAVGDHLKLFALKTGNTEFSWIAETQRGTWEAETPECWWNDDFTGSDGDSTDEDIWRMVSGDVKIKNNMASINADSVDMRLLRNLPVNFDVQVDVHMTPDNVYGEGGLLVADASRDNGYFLELYVWDDGPYTEVSFDSYAPDWENIDYFDYEEGTSVTVRLVQVGKLLSAYYRAIGATEWISVGSVTMASPATLLSLGAYVDDPVKATDFYQYDNFKFNSGCPLDLIDVTPFYWRAGDDKVLWTSKYTTDLIGWGCWCDVSETGGWLTLIPVGGWEVGFRPAKVMVRLLDPIFKFKIKDTAGNQIAFTEDIAEGGSILNSADGESIENLLSITWQGHDIGSISFSPIDDYYSAGLLWGLRFSF